MSVCIFLNFAKSSHTLFVFPISCHKLPIVLKISDERFTYSGEAADRWLILTWCL